MNPLPPNQDYKLEIVVQPATEVRFRYARDNTSSIIGATSTRSKRTVPTLTTNYRGKIRVFATLVDSNNRPHPHSLVGQNCTNNGICEFEVDITESNHTIEFNQIGIQRAIKSQFANEMRKRQQHWFGDPFGFGCDCDPGRFDSINPHEVRIAFVAVVESTNPNQRPNLLGPITSDTVRDSRASLQLKIIHASEWRGPANGGLPLILLTEKVNGDKRVNVVFHDPRISWSAYADPTIMHKRFAFATTVPAYRDTRITESVFVLYFLLRQQEKRIFDPFIDQSNPIQFEYYPGPEGDALRMQHDKYINDIINTMFNQDDVEHIEAIVSELEYHDKDPQMPETQFLYRQPCDVIPHSFTAKQPYEQPYLTKPITTVQQPFEQPSLTKPITTVQQPFEQPYLTKPISTVQQPFEQPYLTKPITTVQQPFEQPNLTKPISTVQQPFEQPYITKPISTKQPPFGQPYLMKPISTVQQPFEQPYLTKPISTKQPPFGQPYLMKTISTVQQPLEQPYLKKPISTVQQPFDQPYHKEPHSSIEQQPTERPNHIQPNSYMVLEPTEQPFYIQPNLSTAQKPSDQFYNEESHPYSKTYSFEDYLPEFTDLEQISNRQSIAADRASTTEQHSQKTTLHQNDRQDAPVEPTINGMVQMSTTSVNSSDIKLLSDLMDK